jgi:DNA-binding transcriptional ArsR family regulator/uncharacterized protein YndB with AHSA1/START domain
VEAVFRALADPSRRLLLDRLFERDGQTLASLSKDLDMTRFGVMNHLSVLEEAGLVTTRRVGREKLHYLNPVPIRLAMDRWISKFAEPWVAGMAGLKRTLETEQPMQPPRHVYTVYIRTTPERLWEALTDGDLTARYGTRAHSTWEPGAPITRVDLSGATLIDGIVLECTPPSRLAVSWHFLFDPELANERPSRVTYEIEPVGNACKLTLVHDDFEGAERSAGVAANGWPLLLSSLKSLLETGEGLAIPFNR